MVRDILDRTDVKNKFPEHHQQRLVVIRTLRFLWTSIKLELSISYRSNRRLAKIISQPMKRNTLFNYINTRTDGEMHNKSHQGEKEPETYFL